MGDFLAGYNAVIVFVAINGILAYSMHAVLIAGQLSLAQAAFASLAAYVSALLTINAGLPLVAVVVAGMLVGAVAAFLLGLPLLRLRGVYLAIATLGFGEMVRILMLNLEVTGGAQGLRGIPKTVTTWQAWLGLAACAWFFWRLGPSRRGLGLAALRQDETAASAMGVDVLRYRMFAFVVSGAMAGLSGVLFAHFSRFIAPDQFGFSRAVDALLYAIVGGTGHWIGPALGGGLLTGLPELQRAVGVEAGWLRPFINGVILLGVILFLPEGISGLGARLPWRRQTPTADASDGESTLAAPGRSEEEVDPDGQDPTTGVVGSDRGAPGPGAPDRPPAAVLDGVVKDYGGVRAIDGVSLEVPAGEVMGLIGPNGAGKTTLVNIVTGLAAPTAGQVTVLGTPLDGQRPHQVAGLGISRTFQEVKLFDRLSVLDNVLVGSHRVAHHTFLRRLFLLPSAGVDESANLERARSCLDRVGLADHANTPAGSLSYGDRRRLEIGRALASEPSLLVLDEPAAGMNRVESTSLGTLIADIAASGVTILLIEHNVALVMSICSRVAVLDFGRLIADGPPREVAQNPEVIAAYLGDDGAGDDGAGDDGAAHDGAGDGGDGRSRRDGGPHG